MKKLLLNDFGFSMVQGMIIAGVMAGSSLIATRLLSDQKLAQKSAETRDQIEDLHSLIYTALQNRENCAATIIGNGAAGTLLSGSPASINTIRTANPNQVVYSKHLGNINNVYMNGNVTIDDISITYTPANGQADMTITYERLQDGSQAGDANKRTKTGYGAKRITKKLKARVQRDPYQAGRPFVSCYTFTEDKTGEGSLEAGNDVNRDMCLEMTKTTDPSVYGEPAFIWDEANSVCKPNTKCPQDTIFTGIDSNGLVKCRRIEDWVNLQNVIQPTVGTCTAGKRARLKISSDKKTVHVECY